MCYLERVEGRFVGRGNISLEIRIGARGVHCRVDVRKVLRRSIEPVRRVGTLDVFDQGAECVEVTRQRSFVLERVVDRKRVIV